MSDLFSYEPGPDGWYEWLLSTCKDILGLAGIMLAIGVVSIVLRFVGLVLGVVH